MIVNDVEKHQKEGKKLTSEFLDLQCLMAALCYYN